MNHTIRFRVEGTDKNRRRPNALESPGGFIDQDYFLSLSGLCFYAPISLDEFSAYVTDRDYTYNDGAELIVEFEDSSVDRLVDLILERKNLEDRLAEDHVQEILEMSEEGREVLSLMDQKIGELNREKAEILSKLAEKVKTETEKAIANFERESTMRGEELSRKLAKELRTHFKL